MSIFGLGRHKYEDNEKLYNDLFAELDPAFEYLNKKVRPTILQISKLRHLSKEEGEDLIQDSILLFILKIKNGEYKFEGHSPATYVIASANLFILNLLRKKAKIGVPENTAVETSDEDFIEILEFKDSTNVLDRIISSELGENCRKLIWLKYFDGFKDAEVIEQNLTQYKSAQSLQNARGECMKKLIGFLEGLGYNRKQF
jgi:RNA polymerase sigma factor (sigma-70 family)